MSNAPTAPAAFTSSATPEIRSAIEQWNEIKKWQATAAVQEMELRKKIVAHFFPKPREGSNRLREPGLDVKVTQTVSRKLQLETLDVVMSQMDPDHRRLGTLIKYVPEFSLAWYKALPDDQRLIFDQTLEIKDGSPQLEIVLSNVEFASSVGQVPNVQTETPVKRKYTRKPKA